MPLHTMRFQRLTKTILGHVYCLNGIKGRQRRNQVVRDEDGRGFSVGLVPFGSLPLEKEENVVRLRLWLRETTEPQQGLRRLAHPR